jgi:hypothetical protein
MDTRHDDKNESVQELAERWKNVHTEDSYGPQGKALGMLARAFLDESAIVDRCWKALGIETYEQAKPYTIDQHIARRCAPSAGGVPACAACGALPDESCKNLLAPCIRRPSATTETFGPCSCEDDGKCRYVNGGPACMNEESAPNAAVPKTMSEFVHAPEAVREQIGEEVGKAASERQAALSHELPSESVEAMRQELAAVAVACGRSKADGHDVDWHELHKDVAPRSSSVPIPAGDGMSAGRFHCACVFSRPTDFSEAVLVDECAYHARRRGESELSAIGDKSC